MDIVEFQSLFAAPVRNGIYKAKDFQGRGVRLVKMNQLFSERRLRSQADGYELIDLTERERQILLLKKNDLLFSRTSVVADGVGKCSIIAEVEEELTWDSNIIRVRLNPDLANPQFYFYFFNSPDGRDVVKRLSSGAAVTTITGSGLAASCVPSLPLPMQRRIAGILSAYDELIENSQRRIKILEAMARVIYREWFVSEILPGSVMARGPRKGRIGELCALVKVPFSERLHASRPLLDLSRMPQHSLAPGETGAASELTTSRILFEPGDTLFGAIRCYLHKVNAAHFSGVTNTSVLVLRPKIAAFRSLVAIVASDAETIRWADTHSTGTKMPVINWGVLQSMPAPLPSEALAKAFEEVAGPMLDQIGVLAKRIQNLRRTRDLLLPRLLSGQVEVEAA